LNFGIVVLIFLFREILGIQLRSIFKVWATRWGWARHYAIQALNAAAGQFAFTCVNQLPSLGPRGALREQTK
jgi:hypothetical protein